MRLIIGTILLALSTTSIHAETLHAIPFARDLGEARTILALDDGTLLVSRPSTFDVVAVRDRDGDGRADEVRTAVSSIEGAHGLAMRDRTLYVAGTRRIVAAERLPDGTFGPPREVVGDLPDGGRDTHRTLAVGRDGTLYVTIPEHGTLMQIEPGGATRRVFARGFTGVDGLAFDPATGELWGNDGEELSRIGDGVREPSGKHGFGALAFDGASAYGVSKGGVVRMAFADGKPGAPETIATIAGAQLTGFASAKGSLFVSDARGSIYRLANEPQTMTSNAGEPAAMAILARVFALRDLPGAGAVLHDEELDTYLVSGTGFIARVSPDGKVLERNAFDGVTTPKGMAIDGIELWVADGTSVRVFERTTGTSLRTIDLEPHGAVSLSHVAVGADGAVYVTDTDVRVKPSGERVRAGDGRIFRIEADGDVEIAIHGEELRSPAGIVWDGMRFLVAQAYGNEIVAWQPGHPVKAVLRGPGAYDGLAILPNGTIMVTSANDDAVHAGTTGELRPLFPRSPTPAGIAFDRKRNRLLIPSTGGAWLESWTLPPMSGTPAGAADYEPSLKTSPRSVLSAEGFRDTSSTTR